MIFNVDVLVIANKDITMNYSWILIPKGTKGIVVRGGELPVVNWFSYKEQGVVDGDYLDLLSKNTLEEFINWIYSGEKYRIAEKAFSLVNRGAYLYDDMLEKEALRLIDKFYMR